LEVTISRETIRGSSIIVIKRVICIDKLEIGSPESKSTNNSTKSKEENTAKNPIDANNHSTYFKDTEVKHNPSVSVINPIIENKIEEYKQEPIDNALKMPIKKYKKAKSCKCLIV
jgi:hypothetical protein